MLFCLFVDLFCEQAKSGKKRKLETDDRTDMKTAAESLVTIGKKPRLEGNTNNDPMEAAVSLAKLSDV